MMGRRGSILMGFAMSLGIVFSISGDALSQYHVYIGVVVGVEPKIIRTRGMDGTVSVFWIGRKTQWKSGRIPQNGEKVSIRYVKDKLHRNAVVELVILKDEVKIIGIRHNGPIDGY